MPEEILDWYIDCDAETFAKCKNDPKFAYIVTLARSVNALNFVVGALPSSDSISSPANTRDRLNGYFVMCALFFEVLRLVQSMGKTFRDDALFRSGLQTLLEDETAKRIRRMNLHPARNNVFHFLPEHFAEKIKIQPPAKCLFLKARGKKKKDVYCTFADTIVIRTLVGDVPDILGEFEVIAAATEKLVPQFVNDAERLISFHLTAWGFRQHGGNRLSDSG
jgi:hypothetical protein